MSSQARSTVITASCRLAWRCAGAVLGLSLAACTNLSGLGGGSEFQCKAPDGVPCMSVSGVHANERAQNLPAQRAGVMGGSASRLEPAQQAPADPALGPQDGVQTAPKTTSTTVAYRKTPLVPDSGVRGADAVTAMGAIRSEPTIIRIWVAPWEDADGDLNDQGYIYLQVDSGRWLIEHNRAQIRREFAPVRAGGQVTTGAPPTAKPAAASAAPGAKGSMSKEEAIAIGRAISQGAGKAIGAAQEQRP